MLIRTKAQQDADAEQEGREQELFARIERLEEVIGAVVAVYSNNKDVKDGAVAFLCDFTKAVEEKT